MLNYKKKNKKEEKTFIVQGEISKIVILEEHRNKYGKYGLFVEGFRTDTGEQIKQYYASKYPFKVYRGKELMDEKVEGRIAYGEVTVVEWEWQGKPYYAPKEVHIFESSKFYKDPDTNW